MASPFRIRLAEPADAGAVAAAEKICFSDPWSEGSIAELIESSTVSGFLAESSGAESRLAGYVFGRSVAGEAEIMTFGVLPEYRRRGLGRELLDTAIRHFESAGLKSIFLEVRTSNDEARRLYSGRGFRPIGMRIGYYRNPVEDALVLQLDLKRDPI